MEENPDKCIKTPKKSLPIIDNDVKFDEDSICEAIEIPTIVRTSPVKVFIAEKPVKVFKTPKIASLQREIPTDSPLTPMPSFVSMDTPNLKDELKRFGIKALPRKQAVRKLVEIYEYTHKNKLMRKSKSCTDLCDTSKNKKSEAAKEIDLIEASSTTKSIIKPKKSKLKKTMSNLDTVIEKLKPKVVTADNDLAQFENDDPITFSQQVSSLSEDEIKEKVYEYIKNNNDLYNKVLNYEPLDFESFFQEIKNLGQFKISTKLLMKILDEQCVTFTLKNIRSKVSKFRSRKKN